MLFGSEVQNRVRKCYSCQALIEGSDSDYASHYAEVHESDPLFACELCDDVSTDSSLYQSHIKSHFSSIRSVKQRSEKRW